jgi:hypothetical protein
MPLEGCTPIEVPVLGKLHDHDLAVRCLEVVRRQLPDILPESSTWRAAIISLCHHHPENCYPALGIFGSLESSIEHIEATVNDWIDAKTLAWIVQESRKVAPRSWKEIRTSSKK